MRCIFCKCDSSSSRSREHIIPESLWNVSHVLPPGIVCDKCNNYFAREIEKPFSETPAILALRFHEALPSKRGIIPPLAGMLRPNIPAIIYRHTKGEFVGTISQGNYRQIPRQQLSDEVLRVLKCALGKKAQRLCIEPMQHHYAFKVRRRKTYAFKCDWVVHCCREHGKPPVVHCASL